MTETVSSPAAEELPKQYDHTAAQDRWYKFWEERGYFNSDPPAEPSPSGRGQGEGDLSPSAQQSFTSPHVWMINLARGTDQLDRLSFDPLKPSFLLAVTKN